MAFPLYAVIYAFFLVILYFGRQLLVYVLTPRSWRAILIGIVVTNTIGIAATILLFELGWSLFTGTTYSTLTYGVLAVIIVVNLGNYLIKAIADLILGMQEYTGRCSVNLVIYRHNLALYLLRFVQATSNKIIEVEVPETVFKSLSTSASTSHVNEYPYLVHLTYLSTLRLALRIQPQQFDRSNTKSTSQVPGNVISNV